MFYLIIGWIIVVGFAATLVITLLSLVGKMTIEEQYKKVLFRSLVLEMVAVGFFIFYQGSGNLDDVYGYFLFNQEGEPVEHVVSGHFIFQKPTHTTFKNTPRTFEINTTRDTIFFKTSNDKTYLGFFKITDELISHELTDEHKLYVGLHLCDDDNVLEGKPYLIEALNSPNVNKREKRKGVKKLYKLMDTFKTRQEFDDLIALTDVNSYGNIRYKEIAEINSFAADRLRSLDVAGNESLATIRDNYRLEALSSYLFYLKIQKPDSGIPEIIKLRQKSLDEMNKLFERLKSSQPRIYDKKDVILAAAQNRDINAIESYRDFINAFKRNTGVADKL